MFHIGIMFLNFLSIQLSVHLLISYNVIIDISELFGGVCVLIRLTQSTPFMSNCVTMFTLNNWYRCWMMQQVFHWGISHLIIEEFGYTTSI